LKNAAYHSSAPHDDSTACYGGFFEKVFLCVLSLCLCELCGPYVDSEVGGIDKHRDFIFKESCMTFFALYERGRFFRGAQRHFAEARKGTGGDRRRAAESRPGFYAATRRQP